MTRNSELLESFVTFCRENPDLRFWQALRNWSQWSYVYVSQKAPDVIADETDVTDTFYWEKNHGSTS